MFPRQVNSFVELGLKSCGELVRLVLLPTCAYGITRSRHFAQAVGRGAYDKGISQAGSRCPVVNLDEHVFDAHLILLRDASEIPHHLASRLVMNQHPL
jgi:hypothetical protein